MTAAEEAAWQAGATSAAFPAESRRSDQFDGRAHTVETAAPKQRTATGTLMLITDIWLRCRKTDAGLRCACFRSSVAKSSVRRQTAMAGGSSVGPCMRTCNRPPLLEEERRQAGPSETCRDRRDRSRNWSPALRLTRYNMQSAHFISGAGHYGRNTLFASGGASA